MKVVVGTYIHPLLPFLIQGFSKIIRGKVELSTYESVSVRIASTVVITCIPLRAG